jgi:hypothetical protein
MLPSARLSLASPLAPSTVICVTFIPGSFRCWCSHVDQGMLSEMNQGEKMDHHQ